MDGFIKMAVRAGLILTITAAVLILFAGLTIPNLNFQYFTQGVSSAMAIVYHWVPASQQIISVAIACLGIIVTIKIFELASMAYRWIMKVNEG